MFEEYLKRIKELKLPKGKFSLFGSAPIAVRKLRDSRDIDIIVTDDVFEKYKQDPNWKYNKFERDDRTVEMLEQDNIELYKDWGPGEWDIEKLIRESEIIDDLPFVRLEEVVKWKKISGRGKDKKDIELIENNPRRKTAIILHGMPSKKEYYNPKSPAQSNKHSIGFL